jgi:hypothetical protein
VVVDDHDKSTALLFGDGAAVTLSVVMGSMRSALLISAPSAETGTI